MSKFFVDRRMVPLLSLAVLACVAGALEAQAAATRRPPNILLIVSDDQGYADAGCCGNPEIQTPHLDRLAAEGVRVTQFYVTWPACTPSRGSILTGRYPQRNGLYDMIRNNEVDFGFQFDEASYAVSPEMTLGLDLRELTLGQMLKQAGYASGAVGKWDSGRARRFLPLQRGFDFFYGFANTGIDYWTHERYGIASLFRGNQRIREEGYATDLFEREARGFIERNRDRPWFLYLPFNAPHAASSLTCRDVQAQDAYLRRYEKLDPEKKRTKYMAAVTNMDAAIGRILDRVRELGQEQQTLVIFFSDNGGGGPCDNGPLRGFKGQLFEGGLRVPFLARWPGVLPRGVVRDEFLSTLEIFPTLLAAAGGTPPPGLVLDGFNMLPVLQGTAASPRTTMFWQQRENRAARSGHYKWVQSAKGAGLFDLSADVGEQHDLSGARPQILAELQSRWNAWRREMDQAEPRGPFRDY
jgi:arylsulfatase A-like enzyme